MRPSVDVRIPLEAFSPFAYLSEMLDCLNPFYGGLDSIFEYEEEFESIEHNQLFSDLEL